MIYEPYELFGTQVFSMNMQSRIIEKLKNRNTFLLVAERDGRNQVTNTSLYTHTKSY